MGYRNVANVHMIVSSGDKITYQNIPCQAKEQRKDIFSKVKAYQYNNIPI